MLDRSLNSQKRLDRLTLAGFFLSLLVTLSLAAFGFKVSSQQLEAAYWVAHTQEVLGKIADTRTALVEIESGERGFVITGKESYLESYTSALDRLGNEVATLRTLTIDNSRQQVRLIELDVAIQPRIGTGRAMINARRTSGFDAAQSLLEADLPKQQMDRLHRVLNELDREEEGLLQNRMALEETSVKRFWTGMATLVGVLFLTLTGLYLIISNGSKRHSRLLADMRGKDAVLSRFRTALDNAGDAIYLVDRRTMRFVDVNQTACDMTGYSRDELLLMGPEHIFADLTRQQIEESYDLVIAGKGASARTEGNHQRKNGSIYPVELTRCYLPSEDSNIIVGIARDISERVKSRQIIRENQVRLEAAFSDAERSRLEIHTLSELSEVLLACTSPEEAYTPIGKFCEVLFPKHYGACYLIHPSRNYLEAVASWGDTANGETLFAPDACWALRRGQAHRSDDLSGTRCQHLHSVAAHRTTVCVPMTAMGDTLGVLYLELNVEDDSSREQELATMVAERVALAVANLRLRITLRNQSIRDPLTGLYNRRYLEEALHKDLARCKRDRKPLSLLMIDVDHFKTFNDTRGHDAGDAVLRNLGLMMTSLFRESDSVCRYGGEEFTVVLADADAEQAGAKAEQLRQAVCASAIEWNNARLDGITVSIGIATLGEHIDTPGSLIETADRALYEAKRTGRNRVVTSLVQPAAI